MSEFNSCYKTTTGSRITKYDVLLWYRPLRKSLPPQGGDTIPRRNSATVSIIATEVENGRYHTAVHHRESGGVAHSGHECLFKDIGHTGTNWQSRRHTHTHTYLQTNQHNYVSIYLPPTDSSICPYSHPAIHSSTSPPAIRPSPHLPTHLPIHRPIQPAIYPPIHNFVYPHTHTHTHTSVFPPNYLHCNKNFS
jgi:hypothetical protein